MHEEELAEIPVADNPDIDRVRLRIVDAAGELRPLGAGLPERIEHVRAELRAVGHELAVMAHVAELEEDGLTADVLAFERRLDDGWVPEGRPVADVVADLRAEFV